MFCKNCGAQVDSAVLYCPRCGKEVQSQQGSEDDPFPPAASEKKGYPFWFKILIGVGIIGILIGIWDSYRTENPVTTIEAQLNALRDNKITEAYYGFTSKDFQESTSLDVFREFIKAYPVFSQNKTFTFSKKDLSGAQGIVEGSLLSKDGIKAPVQYRVIKDGDSWKILSIQLLKSDRGEVVIDQSIKEALKAPIEAQLRAFQSQDFNKAYKGLVSKDFEKETSFDNFLGFVKQYPLLTNFTHYDFNAFTTKGDQADVMLILDSHEGKTPIEYKLIKEDGKWKVWSLRVILPYAQNETDEKILTQLINDELSALKAGDIKKAYEAYTSQDFRKITSFAAFEDFINRYPLLKNYQKIDIRKPEIKKDTGSVKADLEMNQNKSTLEFLFGHENGQWKIWGIQVLKKNEEPANLTTDSAASKEFDSKDLEIVIEDQLKTIRDKKPADAYHQYTSKDFQNATTLEDFESFINNQPAFSQNQKIVFNQLTFNNNIANYSGSLVTRNDKEYQVEYDLINENGKWKILHIQVFTQPEKEEEQAAPVENGKPMEFSKFELGNSIDLEGKILDPKTILERNAGDIFVNVGVSNGVAGTKIELDFEHIESRSHIPLVSTALQRNGESMVSFVFSPPTGGWPKGNYRIVATSSTGEKKSIEFKIE